MRNLLSMVFLAMNTTDLLLFAMSILIMATFVFVMSFNGLSRSRQKVREAWTAIDKQLKRRRGLIPSLLEACKAYALREKDIFNNLNIYLREDKPEDDLAKKSKTEQRITRELGKLGLLAQKYPEMKADANFQKFQQGLMDIEDKIQMARQYYNAVVRDHNAKLASFPGKFVGPLVDMPTFGYFDWESNSASGNPQAKS